MRVESRPFTIDAAVSLTPDDRELIRAKAEHAKKWLTLKKPVIIALLDEIDYLENQLRKIVTHD